MRWSAVAAWASITLVAALGRWEWQLRATPSALASQLLQLPPGIYEIERIAYHQRRTLALLEEGNDLFSWLRRLPLPDRAGVSPAPQLVEWRVLPLPARSRCIGSPYQVRLSPYTCARAGRAGCRAVDRPMRGKSASG